MRYTCPFCREAISEQDMRTCPACSTPHHQDCYEENGGCTIFGCQEAPGDEEKLDLTSAFSHSSQAAANIRQPPPLGEEYIVSRGGQRFGPYSRDQIRAHLAEARMTPSDLVWAQGMPGWLQASQVSGLLPSFSPSAHSSYHPLSSNSVESTQTSGLAVASMIFGIVSLMGACAFVIPTLIAIVLGHVALSQCNNNRNLKGKGMAIAGLAMGWTSVPLYILLVIITSEG